MTLAQIIEQLPDGGHVLVVKTPLDKLPPHLVGIARAVVTIDANSDAALVKDSYGSLNEPPWLS